MADANKYGDLFTNCRLSWFGQGGPESDVVLASRVRLARNFAGYPFPNRADISHLAQTSALSAPSLIPVQENIIHQKLAMINMEDISSAQQEVLVDKQLIRKNLIEHPANRYACISEDRATVILINEEDHIRIHCMASGLDLETPLKRAMEIDNAVEARGDIAFDEKLGYLTSCPTNLGTGLRATVLLHLPGLVFTDNIQKITAISQQLGLMVRPLFGEGMKGEGNIFQVANQLTLGFAEETLLDNLKSAVTEIIENERRARKALEMYSSSRLQDATQRSYGVLRYAHRLELTETLTLFSKVRLGIDMGFPIAVKPELFSVLIVAAQPNIIRYLAHNENLSQPEIEESRARLVQSVLLGDSSAEETI